MGQNKASLVLPPDQVGRINDLLLRLEDQLEQLIAMPPQQRQRLLKMGPGSEVFARRALEALEQNHPAQPCRATARRQSRPAGHRPAAAHPGPAQPAVRPRIRYRNGAGQ